MLGRGPEIAPIHSDELKFQRGAAAKAEAEQGDEGRKDRYHANDGRYGVGAKISSLPQRFGVLSRDRVGFGYTQIDPIRNCLSRPS